MYVQIESGPFPNRPRMQKHREINETQIATSRENIRRKKPELLASRKNAINIRETGFKAGIFLLFFDAPSCVMEFFIR